MKIKEDKKRFLENEVNENVIAWLKDIDKEDKDADNKVVNRRHVKKRVKRTRTISQMDTNEFRESRQNHLLDSVSLDLDCEYCGLVFPSTASLVDHVQSRHEPQFRRDYLKGKFTQSEEQDMQRTEDPLKQIKEGKINVNKLFDRRRRDIETLGK
uniref:C2H2-type domain-containing protein n=1 Tax=Cacopsylla melanoneura TaxID=428564 RepID=A0A8D8WV47_9HEMI